MKRIKKAVTLITAAAMVLVMTAAPTFADVSLTDVSGTVYEEAVSTLVSEGFISGYPDNTFRPKNNISRAEACVLVSKAFLDEKSSDSTGNINISGAFSDIAENYWAADYIAAAYSNGIITGYGDGTFRPTANVTNNEFIAMLLRATGWDTSDMSWPDDYAMAATAAGITDNKLHGISLDVDLNDAAIRGNCAIMLYNIYDTDTPDNSGDEPDQDDQSKPSDNDSSTTDTDNGILTDYSGQAYGIVTSTGRSLNSKGETVDSINFLMGDKEYSLLAKSSVTISPGIGTSSGLVQVKLSKGEVTEVTPITNEKVIKSKSTDSCLMTPSADDNSLQMYKVEKSGKTYAYYVDKDGNSTYLGINTPVVVYNCEPDGSSAKYELGSVSDIYEGCYIAAFSIDKDSDQLADVVIVVSDDDADEVLRIDEQKNYGTLR
jgi:hypothetical protein